MSDAVQEVKKLDALTIPLEKLLCMKETTVKITTAVEKHLEQQGKKGGKSGEMSYKRIHFGFSFT